jgi:PadR family transcriptional regulator AphA
MTTSALSARTLTTTEAAVLSVLALDGERSGYDLLKRMSTAFGYVWAPAKSQLYAVLPRLARDGLATQRTVAQTSRPDKQLYAISADGRATLDAWLAHVDPDATDAFFLKLFVGGLTTHEVLSEHVEAFRAAAQARLGELRAIESTNERSGNDAYHYFVLRLGIERAEHAVAWAEWVLSELREPA